MKERPGHGSITTTEKYLHTLPGADTAALAALDSIRGMRGVQVPPAPAPRQAEPGEEKTDRGDELAQMVRC